VRAVNPALIGIVLVAAGVGVLFGYAWGLVAAGGLLIFDSVLT
jgi:hypothetical protein